MTRKETFITHESSRLFLRHWQENDADQLFLLGSDPDTGPSAGWAPLTSREEALATIRGVYSLPEAYAVIQRQNGALVGSAMLYKENYVFDLSFWIGAQYHGQGFATEAASLLLEHGFTVLKADTVTACCRIQNLPCRRVLEKLDFLPNSTPTQQLDPISGNPVSIQTYRLSAVRWGASRFHTADL